MVELTAMVQQLLAVHRIPGRTGCHSVSFNQQLNARGQSPATTSLSFLTAKLATLFPFLNLQVPCHDKLVPQFPRTLRY